MKPDGWDNLPPGSRDNAASAVTRHSPVMEPRVLYALKQCMRRRRAHRRRARQALRYYLDAIALGKQPHRFALALMRAQEASRGSRVHARRLHEQWESAVRVVRGDC